MASFGEFTPRANHFVTLWTGTEWTIELRTSTSDFNFELDYSSWLAIVFLERSKSQDSGLIKSVRMTSTEWRKPSKSTKETMQSGIAAG